jgi:hypothetical protein
MQQGMVWWNLGLLFDASLRYKVTRPRGLLVSGICDVKVKHYGEGAEESP